MKIKKTLPQLGVILFFIIALASCEEDFNTLGVDIIGDDIIDAVPDFDKTVIAYSRKMKPIETNNLPVYQLGVYNDPVYGKSTVDAVSQLILSEPNPTFGDGIEEFPPTVDSVYLYVPFFSESTTTDETVTYQTDSIFGNNPIDIRIYESNYFLSDFDPESNFEESQKYYSDLGTDIESNKGELLGEATNFTPSAEGFILTRLGDDDEQEELKVAPGIRVALPIDFFTEKIVDMAGSAALINNNNFKEYFRGLYFDVESVNGSDNGSLFLFDFTKAEVKIHYNYDKEVTDINDEDEDGDTSDKIIENQNAEYVFTFNGINVNLYENDNVIGDITPDTDNGDESLYLRGGDGYITVVELFGDEDELYVDENGMDVFESNGVSDELDRLRYNKWLINEANLIFYVDQDKVTGGDQEPDRLFIYDLNNNLVLADYGFDLTQGESQETAFNEHLGILERGNDENGDYYKIKITTHVSNLINKDSSNVSLGLVVSQNVVQGGFQDLQETQSPNIESIPSSCVVSPEGTVLYGNATANEEKKLKLRIYYTDPN